MSDIVSAEHADLLNTGLFTVNADAIAQGPDAQMTLLVLGAPRGGTSAIAGALAKLGIFMGDGASEPVFEGLKLANAMENGTREQAQALIEEYDRAHRVWAHKRPGFTRLMQEYRDAFRNPVYLVIMRDPVATVSRGVISGRLKGNHLKKLRQVLQKYESIISFAETSGAPAVFISYEKLLQEPGTVIEQLLETLRIDVSQDKIVDAVHYVEPSPSQYLEVSRSNRCRGAWERFDDRVIAGWAEYVNRTMNQPPKVALFNGEQEIARTIAASGEDARGYEFDLDALGVSASPALRVRVHGEIRDLARPAYTGNHKLRYYLRSLLGALGLNGDRGSSSE